MALIPDDPREQKFFLGILVVVVAAVGYYYYLHAPKAEELVELEDRIAEIEYHNRQAEARTGNLEETRAQLASREQLFSALEDLVPRDAEVPAIYDAIASESEVLGLDLVSVIPSQPQSQAESYFLRQSWEMTVQGEYHSVGRFLSRVASFPRIVRPDVRSINSAGQTNSGRQRVEARFTLETYVMPPDTGSAGDGEE